MAKDVKFNIKLLVDGKDHIVEASTDVKRLAQELEIAQTDATKARDALVKMTQIGASFQNVIYGMQQLTGVFGPMISANNVQIEAETKLTTVMRQRMGATEDEIRGIMELASAQQKLGVIGDEVQLAGAQQIATFLKEKSSLETLVPAMNNLLAQQKGLNATGQDAASIGNLLGKAMQGQVSALTRVGITFTEAQKEAMTFGTEEERAATLARIITDNVGEMNAALAKTDAGKAKQMANDIGDFQEKIGSVMSRIEPMIKITGEIGMSLMSAGTIWKGMQGAIIGIEGLTKGLKSMKVATYAQAAASKVCTSVQSLWSTQLYYGRKASMAWTFGAKAATVQALAMRTAIIGLMAVSGVGLAIAAVSAILSIFSDKSKSAASAINGITGETDKLSEASKEESRGLVEARTEMERSINRLKAFSGTKAQEAKIVDEMNGKYGETMGYFASVSDWYKALTANSEAYCRQMVAEARARTLANRIAEIEQGSSDLQRKMDRGELSKENVKEKYAATSGAYGVETWGVRELPGTSEFMKAKTAIEENRKEAEALRKELEAVTAEAGKAEYKMRGSQTRPQTAGTTTKGTAPQWKDNAQNLKEYEDNIRILQERLQTATAEEATGINGQIALWQEKADAIRNAGKAVEDNIQAWNAEASTLKETEGNISILQERLQTATAEEAAGINKEIALWQDKADAIRNAGKEVEDNGPVYRAEASTLKDITENIDALTQQLQMASMAEAAVINGEITLWQEKADAIRNAGKEAGDAFSKFRDGWGSIQGIGGGLESMTEALSGNGNAWQKVSQLVGGFLTMYEGIRQATALTELLTGATAAHTASKTAEAGATTAAMAATTAETGMAATAAASQTAVIAANNLAAASFMKLAAASYFAAHAYIPFAGFGIASGFIAAATGIVESMNAIAFANGGIVSGPTLGLIGEYAGAGNNPEVVAPLDKLRSMIEPRGVTAGKVEFEIDGRKLRGVLRNCDNLSKRS